MAREPARILIVDDSQSIVNSLSKILQIHGYATDTAFNGSDALRKITSQNYDLIICDIEMPGVTGLDFLERIRSTYESDVDVILMTGYLDQDYFIRAIRLGAADFIRKPIDAKQIIFSIQGILDRRRNRFDLSNFFLALDNTEISFLIDPLHFSKFSLSKVFNGFFIHNFLLSQNVLNELLIIIDEMVYNAFIHGTLKLNHQERQFDHGKMQELIRSKLQDPEIMKKRIGFKMSVNQVENLIQISVEDQGEGFDYQGWLNRVQTDPRLNIEEHGRGISLLFHLTDSVEFSQGGRKISVSKRVNFARPEPDEIS